MHSLNVPARSLHIWPDDGSFGPNHVAKFVILITLYIYIYINIVVIDWNVLLYCAIRSHTMACFKSFFNKTSIGESSTFWAGNSKSGFVIQGVANFVCRYNFEKQLFGIFVPMKWKKTWPRREIRELYADDVMLDWCKCMVILCTYPVTQCMVTLCTYPAVR